MELGRLSNDELWGDDETSKGVGRRGKSEGTAEFALSFAEDGSGKDRELGRPASLFSSTATVRII